MKKEMKGSATESREEGICRAVVRSANTGDKNGISEISPQETKGGIKGRRRGIKKRQTKSNHENRH